MIDSRGITWFVEKRIIERLPEGGGAREFHFGDFGKMEVTFRPAPGDPLEFRVFPAADPYMNAYKDKT